MAWSPTDGLPGSVRLGSTVGLSTCQVYDPGSPSDSGGHLCSVNSLRRPLSPRAAQTQGGSRTKNHVLPT